MTLFCCSAAARLASRSSLLGRTMISEFMQDLLQLPLPTPGFLGAFGRASTFCFGILGMSECAFYTTWPLLPICARAG